MTATGRSARTPFVGFAAALVLLVGVSVTLYWEHLATRKASDLTAHTLLVLNDTQQLLRHLVDAESGERGYLITNRRAFLEPYAAGLAVIPADIERLRKRVADNPAQQERMARLLPLIDEKLDQLRTAIEQHDTVGEEAVVPLVAQNGSRRTMDHIRDLIDEMGAEERALLVTRRADREGLSSNVSLLIAIASSLAIVLVAIGLALMQRDNAERLRAERRERETASRLAVTLSSIGDAVIATDPAGRVVFMNRVAEALTAWPLAQARGRMLDDVFRIVNEETRAPVESPVTKVLRTGTVVGLANHTVLLARDGTEIPIDDSGAPVRDGSDEVMGVVLVFHDCRERKQVEQEARRAAIAETARDLETRAADALRASEQRLQVALKAAQAAAWELDVASGRVQWSAEYYDLCGLDPTIPPSYEHWLSSVVEDDRAAADDVVRRNLQGGPFVPIEYRVRHPLRGVRWLLSMGRVEMEEQTASVMSGIVVDITDRKRAEAERDEMIGIAERARAEAEAANQAKDGFLAVLSHELRSPLSAILGWVGVASASPGDPDTVARALATIDRNVRQQAELVDDLLDVSRIASGRLALDSQAVDLGQTVRDAIESLAATAEAKGVALRTHLPAESVGTVLGDRRRLEQVVDNLLTNAIKFTPRGGRVEVCLERAAGAASVIVRDSGEGIAPEVLPHVFDAFRQEDAAMTRRHGGLGLGLAIVDHIVKSHGGTVTATSPGKGQGAVFTVMLPLRPDGLATPSDAGTFALATAPAALAGIHVLLVDDDPDNREALRLLLSHAGATVTAAGNAAEALAAIEAARPDVMVSDIGMPGRDGYGLVEAVRDLPGKRVQAIAITGFAAPEDRDRALRAGFDAHLPKPIDLPALFAAVARLCAATA